MANELILVIEDDAASRMLECDVLAFAGFRVVEASAAEPGLELARASRPALILMDVRLPGMDGVAALERLRGDPATRNIPVIAVTASAMAGERHRILAAGFDDYHRKPIDTMRLLESVRELVARSEGASRQ